MSDTFSYPPRFMGRSEAARYMAVSITTFDELVADGTFPRAKKLKTKSVWDRVDLDRAATGVPEDGRSVKQQMFDHYQKQN